MIQKLRAVLQSPVFTALLFPPTALVALEVLTFAMLSERNMPQGLHKHIASLWSGHLALCCRLQNSDTERSQLSVRAHLQADPLPARKTTQEPRSAMPPCPWTVPLLQRLTGIASWPQHELTFLPGRGVPLRTSSRSLVQPLSLEEPPSLSIYYLFSCLSYWLTHCPPPKSYFV